MSLNRYILSDRLPPYSPESTEISIQSYSILQPNYKWSHTHDYYEFFVVEDGDALHKVNSKSFKIGRGTLCFIRPDDAHAFLTYKSIHYKMFNIVMSTDFFDEINSFMKGSVSALLTADVPPTINLSEARLNWFTQLLNRIAAEEPSPRRETMLREFFVNAFCELLFVDDTVKTLPAWLHALLTALEDDDSITEPFSKIAAGFNVSREYVSRAFRKYLGVTPSQYMNERRIMKAAKRIEDGDDDLTAVCFDCGFNYYNYFYKQFRVYFHMTPSEYREHCRKK